MAPRSLPPRPDLDHLKKQAKDLLKAHRSAEPEALVRFRESVPRLSEAADTEVLQAKLSLRDAQLVIAREYGFKSWHELKRHVESLQEAPKLVEVSVDAIRISLASSKRVVMLRVKDSSRYLPIWIGPAEADLIAMKLRDITVPRPLTHDLLDSTISDLGAKLTRVVVSELRGDTFYAKIVIETNGDAMEKDCRPSDAIALAVRRKAPIFAAEAVVEKAGFDAKEKPIDKLLTEYGPKAVTGEGNYSQRARAVLSAAREEALRLNHAYIGTEHVLLALVDETGGVAARVLSSLGVGPDAVRTSVESAVGLGDEPITNEIVLTPRAKRAITLAEGEAQRLNHRYVGTEHLLIGLLLEREGAAAVVLESLHIEMEAVRAETMRIQRGGLYPGSPSPG